MLAFKANSCLIDLFCVIFFVKFNKINLKGCKQSLIKFQITSNPNTAVKQNKINYGKTQFQQKWHEIDLLWSKKFPKTCICESSLIVRKGRWILYGCWSVEISDFFFTKRSLFLKPKCLSHGHAMDKAHSNKCHSDLWVSVVWNHWSWTKRWIEKKNYSP